MGKRALITDGLSEKGLQILRVKLEIIESQSLEELKICDALIVRSRTKVAKEVIEAGLPRLKVIGRAGVGIDNIDLDAARDLGIIVVNSPQGATISVAEHTFGLILSLARHIPQADSRMKHGDWPKQEWMGTQLAGKTLGILGYGRIGSMLAELGRKIGMRVIFHDPLLPVNKNANLAFERVELTDLLERADFLSLHLPLNDHTRGMIGDNEMKLMKPTSFIINTARGGILEEKALLTALDSGRIAGAALDVFEQEPPGNSALIRHPKLITTPHIAAQTAEAQAQASMDIAHEVLAALAGEPLRWRVV